MTFLGKQIPIFTPKISDDLFYSSIMFLRFFLSLFSISLLCQMSYMTHSSREKPLFKKLIPWSHLLFTLFLLSRTSDNTTSQNIGGRMHGPFPHPTYLGDRPQSPLGLRPWLFLFLNS